MKQMPKAENVPHILNIHENLSPFSPLSLLPYLHQYGFDHYLKNEKIYHFFNCAN